MPIKQDTHIEKHLLQDSNVMNEIQDIVFGLLNEGGMELRVLTSASNSRFRFFALQTAMNSSIASLRVVRVAMLFV